MPGKRPHPDDGPNGDNKRPRSNNGSPAGATKGSSIPSNLQAQIAEAKAKAAAAKERLQQMHRPTSNSPSLGTAQAPPPPPPPQNQGGGSSGQDPADAARARIEALKARMAAARSGGSTGTPPQRAPAPSAQVQRPPPPPPPPAERDDPNTKSQRGGLGIGLHPMLMNDMASSSAPDKSRSIGTKFGTTIGNRRPDTPASVPASNQYDLSAPSLEDVKANPYFDASLGNATAAPKERRTRELLFHQKGKFIAQAAALRRQAQLEDMKHRIAEQARKAGLAEDRSEQSFIVPEPPDVEWWDESLLVSRQVDGDDGEKVEKFAYPDITALDGSAVKAVVKIDVEDSVITSYVQHPVLLAAPQEKIPVVARGLYLTKKELKKKRRQQRLEILQEKQAKVRLGLEPPEPPKIKKSNLMRVLGEEAVKDPTAVEARVNRDIAERREKHETTNQENKLTAEQRHEKLAKNQEKDKAKGLMMCVFRIDSLAFGKHRYRVDVNAKQLNLTGMTILNPKLNLVIIEGGQWAINKYKKLMLQRIDWTENGFSTQQSSDAPNHNKHEAAAESTWLKPEDEDGRLKDLSENKCVLVWEGEEKQQAFKYWSNKVCETDSEARRALERNKMEYMWARAKDWTG